MTDKMEAPLDFVICSDNRHEIKWMETFKASDLLNSNLGQSWSSTYKGNIRKGYHIKHEETWVKRGKPHIVCDLSFSDWEHVWDKFINDDCWLILGALGLLISTANC